MSLHSRLRRQPMAGVWRVIDHQGHNVELALESSRQMVPSTAGS